MRKNRNAILTAAVATLFVGGALPASGDTWDGDAADGLWATPGNWVGDALPASGADILFDDTAAAASTGASIAGTSRTVGTLNFTRSTGFTLSRTGAATINVNSAVNVTGTGVLTATDVFNRTDVTQSNLLNVTGSLAGTALTFGRVAGTGSISATGRFQLWEGVNQTWQGSMSGTGILELSHRNAVLTLSGAAGSNQLSGAGPQVNFGTIVLDNGAANNNDRWFGANGNTSTNGQVANQGHGRFKLIGNSSTPTLEYVQYIRSERANSFIEVQNGAGQTATLNLYRIDNGGNGGITTYVGNNLGVDSRIVYRIASIDFLNNGIIGGFSRVGDEFATHDTVAAASRVGVTALPANHASRVNQVNGAGATNNVLANAAQSTLGADTTINSLKIDGAHDIDLGGNKLTLGTGGLIQTNGAGSIDNGTLAVVGTSTSTTSGVGWLYITTASDLDIAANIITSDTGTATHRGIAKNGTGKLTLSGTLTNGTTAGTAMNINWWEGSIDYQSPSNAVLLGQAKGNGGLTKSGSGTLTISQTSTANNFPNEFTGGITVNAGSGPLIALSRDNQPRTTGTGPIVVNAGGTLLFQAGTSTTTAADSTALNDFAGAGTVQVRGRDGTVRTLKSQGALWQPGSSAGILTVDGNLSLEKNGSEFSTLEIEITGSGAVAGVDYDQLAILGTLAGLNVDPNLSLVDLVVNVASGLDLDGDLFTILTSTSSLAGRAFHSVSWEGAGVDGTVTYNSDGTIQLSNVVVPEPGTIALLTAGGAVLLRRGRRRVA